jgi:DNA-binding NarL/FixJ family response regulator
MRVLVYSPVRLFGEGIGAFLRSLERVGAVLVEHDALDLETRVTDFRPDVALLDVTTRDVLPTVARFTTLCPDVTTVAMAVPEVADDVIACADAGFVAYVPRNASTAQMLAIVDLAVRGETVCDGRITRSLFDELSRRRAPSRPLGPDEYLTPREIEMARMLARGLSNKEIARELQLSIATIKNHVHAVLQKLQLGSRTQVAGRLVENPAMLHFPPSGSARRRADA